MATIDDPVEGVDGAEESSRRRSPLSWDPGPSTSFEFLHALCIVMVLVQEIRIAKTIVILRTQI
jgi:hypothetical protein